MGKDTQKNTEAGFMMEELKRTCDFQFCSTPKNSSSRNHLTIIKFLSTKLLIKMFFSSVKAQNTYLSNSKVLVM